MEPDKIGRIIKVTAALERFWRHSHGWASPAAAQLLADARLDRQASFAHTLPDYLELFPKDETEARQIMGYVTLRSMCEGILKLFFSVYWETYNKDNDAPRDKNAQSLSLEKVSFDRLIALYAKKGNAQYDEFLRRVQERGNAIHHFTDKDIGTQDELIRDISLLLDFLLAVNSRLPYPDDAYDPGRA